MIFSVLYIIAMMRRCVRHIQQNIVDMIWDLTDSPHRLYMTGDFPPGYRRPEEIEIPADKVQAQYSRSSCTLSIFAIVITIYRRFTCIMCISLFMPGPGGQNVNNTYSSFDWVVNYVETLCVICFNWFEWFTLILTTTVCTHIMCQRSLDHLK
jgi:hypothetical protein